MNNLSSHTIDKADDNITKIRERFNNGLSFVVGDLHGEAATLAKLMEKIRFDPDKDHIYFVGDYNAGGNVTALLNYMSQYYQADYDIPGFHMIRGNHERELRPIYPLANLPDIIVIRGNNLNFYIVHAGMVSAAFDLINEDIDREPEKRVFAYRLADNTCCYDAPLRQLTWSMKGLYSQHSHWKVWPTEDNLIKRKACIIHGHAPYSFFIRENRYSYGSNNLFWSNQHMFFCQELRSFNLDSDIKGRNQNGETYRGLSCLCLDVYDELLSDKNKSLSTDTLREAENGVFGVKLAFRYEFTGRKTPDTILTAKPEMKTIMFDDNGQLVIRK